MKAIFKTVLCLLLIAALPNTVYAKLRIETTTQDLAAIAQAIGGAYVDVHSLTAGTRDPHFAVAKPSMIRRAFRTDLLLVIGAELETGWLPPLLQSARNAKIQPGQTGYLDLSGVVTLLGKHKAPVTRAMGDVHASGNPHYWLDPRNGIEIARAISKRLSKLDPEHGNDYQTNFKRFKNTIENKFKQWQQGLAHLRNQPVIAYHTSFIYLANAFGFRIVDEVEPKPGISPSAASLAKLTSRIKTENIKWLIMEPYYERRSAHYLNEQTGIHIAVIPQSVGARENIKTYDDLFDAIVTALTHKGNNKGDH